MSGNIYVNSEEKRVSAEKVAYSSSFPDNERTLVDNEVKKVKHGCGIEGSSEG